MKLCLHGFEVLSYSLTLDLLLQGQSKWSQGPDIPYGLFVSRSLARDLGTRLVRICYSQISRDLKGVHHATIGKTKQGRHFHNYLQRKKMNNI